MKAVAFHGIGDIRLDDVKEPRIKKKNDAIVVLTAGAVCGTDLHMIRGPLSGMVKGTILGHEGVGVVEKIGKGVRKKLGFKLIGEACRKTQSCRRRTIIGWTLAFKGAQTIQVDNRN